MMIADIVRYLNYLDTVLLILVGLYAFGGLIAGLRKSMISFVLLIILLLVLFTGLNFFSNLLLDFNFEVNYQGMHIDNFRAFLLNQIIEGVPDGSTIIVPGSETYALALTLIVTATRLVLAFVGSVLIIFIIEPILRVIVKFFIAVFGDKPKEKQPKHHLMGAGVGFLKGMLVAAVLIVPLGGFASVVKELETQTQQADMVEPVSLETTAADGEIQDLNDLFTIVDAIEGMRVKKMISYTEIAFDKPLDIYIFDQAMKMEQDGQSVPLREDLIQVIKIANVYMKYTKDGNEFDIYQVSQEDLTVMFDALKDIKLIKVVIPAAIEYALTLDDVKTELAKYDIDAAELKEIDWAEDIYKLLDAAKEVIALGKLDESRLYDLDTEKVRSIVNLLSSTTIFEKGLPALLDYLATTDELKEYIGGGFVFNFDNLNVAVEMNNLVDIYDEFKKLGLTPETISDIDFKALIADEAKFNALSEMIIKLSESDILKQILPPLADGLVNKGLPAEFQNIINIQGVEDLPGEVRKLLSIVQDVNKLGLPLDTLDLKTLDLANVDNETVTALLDHIFSLEVFDGNEEALFRALFRKMGLANADTIDLSGIDWDQELGAIKNVMIKLVTLVKGANTTNFDDLITIIRDETNKTNLLDAIDSASQSHIMREIIVKLVGDMLKENMPAEFTGMIDLSQLSSEYWREESEKLINIFIDITDAGLFGDGGMTITKDLAVRLINNVFSLRLIDGHEETIFNELFKMIPVIEGFTPNYANVDWDSEPANIINIINALDDFGGITTFDFDGLIQSTDTAKVENLLVALNHSQIIRPMFPKLINKVVTDNATTGNFNLNDFVSPWVASEEISMSDVATWDAEVRLMARIMATAKTLLSGNIDLKTLPIGDPAYNAATAVTYTAENAGLSQMLYLLNHSRIFEIAPIRNVLNDFLINGGLVTTGKVLGTVSDDPSSWDTEINAVMGVLKQTQDLNLLTGDLGAGIQTLTDSAVITGLLGRINESVMLRVLLPEILNNALTTTGLSEWVDPWLTDQLGATGTVQPKTEWDAEIQQFGTIISQSVTFDMTAYDPLTGTDAQVDTLVTILQAMNRTSSIRMEQLLNVLNKLTTGELLTGVTFTAYPSSESEWTTELDKIGITLKAVTRATPLSLEKHPEIGAVLNSMRDSVIFGAVLEDIIGNSFENFGAGYMTYLDLSVVDVHAIDWVQELATVNSLSGKFTELNGTISLESCSSSYISDMMLTASQGVITTQIFGKIINGQLATILGAQNPVDGSSHPLYDYTDQSTLVSNAQNLGTLIEFGNATMILFADSANTEQGILVGNYIQAYDVAEGTPRPTFADTYFPAIMAYANGGTEVISGMAMTTVDYGTEGEMFKAFYQASTPEEKLAAMNDINDNSVLTKAILLSMGY